MFKASLQIAIATGVLTLAIWFFFYVVTPEAPLDAASTMVVAAACFAFVTIIKLGLAKMRMKSGDKND